MGRWVFGRGLNHLHEYTVHEGQLAVASRSPTTHEVFIRKIWMELHHPHFAFVLLTDQREGKTPRKPCFSGPGRSLKYKVVLLADPLEDAKDLLRLEEAAFSHNILDRVSGRRSLACYSGRFIVDVFVFLALIAV